MCCLGCGLIVLVIHFKAIDYGFKFFTVLEILFCGLKSKILHLQPKPSPPDSCKYCN